MFFSSCVTTRRKVVVADKQGNLFCLDWSGNRIPDEHVGLHKTQIHSDISSTGSFVNAAVYCRSLFWAPTLGGLISMLTDGRLVLFFLPQSRLDADHVEAVWLPDEIRHPCSIAVNNPFRVLALGDKEYASRFIFTCF